MSLEILSDAHPDVRAIGPPTEYGREDVPVKETVAVGIVIFVGMPGDGRLLASRDGTPADMMQKLSIFWPNRGGVTNYEFLDDDLRASDGTISGCTCWRRSDFVPCGL
jgi:hypothetical protein